MTKSILPVKAALMDLDETQAWLEGRVPRRILSIPFGGPIPSAKSSRGVDLDGDWFSENTDIYGSYDVLRKDRERLVDFQHSFAPPGPGFGDPTGKMAGVILGKAILDEEPEEDGWWANLWLKAGERRVKLIGDLVRMGAQLFGSSQAMPKEIKADPTTGEILCWPMVMQTLSTAPQNTYSVLRPAKAMLDEAPVSPAIKALLADIEQLRTDLQPTSIVGEGVARDERLSAIEAAFVETLESIRR